MYNSNTYSKSMDQPGSKKVANPARGQLNRENEYFLFRVRAWELFGLARRVWQSSRPASASSSLFTQAESGAYLRDSSRVPRRRPFTYLRPPYAIGAVPPSSSSHAINCVPIAFTAESPPAQDK